MRAPASTKTASVAPDQRAGTVVLFLLRMTLIGCGLGLAGTLGSVVWKIMAS